MEDGLHLLFHFLLPPYLAVLGVFLGLAIDRNGPITCDPKQTYLPDWLFVGVELAGLVGGRLLSHWRRRPYVVQTERGREIMGQLAMASMLLILTGIWFVEAIGTAHISMADTSTATFEPITFYIRCAIYNDRAANGVGWWSVAIVLSISVLVGHWLWADHPPRLDEPQSPAQEERGTR